MSSSFADARRQAEKQGFLGKGDYFKLSEGANRVRLMSMALPHRGTYQGQPNFKWLCYVLDRRDGKVKVYFMPHTIFKMIEALQDNPDYAFTDVPMPYDLSISAKGAGTKEVEYSLIPAKKETPLTPTELDDYAQQTPLSELQAKLKEKETLRASTPTPAALSPVDLDEIPF